MAVQRKYATATDEIVDRLRRLETRVTRYLEAQGFDTQTARPVLDAGHQLKVPNINVSLKDMLQALSTYEEVPLVLDGQTVAYIRRSST